MPIGTPTGNLDIKNATLRTSNLETQNIKIGSIFVGTGNSLEETANVGNSMSNTIQFTNTHTAFTTTGNVTVGKDLTVTGNVTASTFSDGTAQLTGGTWSGSAASLTTAVDIGGVAFDGSASIVPTTFGAATFSGDVTVTEDLTAPFVTGLGHLATKTHTFDPTNNTSKYFLGWTQEEGMEIEIQDNGYNHGGLNRFYITFHWGSAPILSSADISELKKYNFYYTYKFDRLYLWFNETLATDPAYPNVTYTIRMKTLKNIINLTEPGSFDQYIGTTIGVSAASALTRMSVTNINSKVGVGTTSPNEKLQVNGNIAINWNNAARIIMNYDNSYRQGHVLDAGTRMMTLFSTTNDTGGGIAFNTRIGLGSSDTDYGTEKMRITGSGNVGINTTTPYRTLDVWASARPSAYPFAIGGSWSNRANYVAFTVYPGNNKTGFSHDVQLGGGMRPHWCRVLAGAATSGSHTLQYSMYAEFIINTWGTSVDWQRRSGDSSITIGSNGNDNSFKVTVSGGVNGSYPRAWIEVYSENGVYW